MRGLAAPQAKGLALGGARQSSVWALQRQAAAAGCGGTPRVSRGRQARGLATSKRVSLDSTGARQHPDMCAQWPGCGYTRRHTSRDRRRLEPRGLTRRIGRHRRYQRAFRPCAAGLPRYSHQGSVYEAWREPRRVEGACMGLMARSCPSQMSLLSLCLPLSRRAARARSRTGGQAVGRPVACTTQTSAGTPG